MLGCRSGLASWAKENPGASLDISQVAILLGHVARRLSIENYSICVMRCNYTEVFWTVNRSAYNESRGIDMSDRLRRVCLRLEEALIAQIDRAAEINHRSRNAEIISLVERALAQCARLCKEMQPKKPPAMPQFAGDWRSRWHRYMVPPDDDDG